MLPSVIDMPTSGERGGDRNFILVSGVVNVQLHRVIPAGFPNLFEWLGMHLDRTRIVTIVGQLIDELC